MASHRVKVLNTSISPFGMRVLIALNEKGVQYEYQNEDLQNKSQLLLASNPIHKKVPVVIHDEKIVCESLIAVEYIDDAWASKDNPFLPSDPYQRATARFWADFVNKKITAAYIGILGNPSGPVQESAVNDMKDSFRKLDSAMRDVSAGKPYFGGDSIGLVDIAFAPFICFFKTYEVLGNFKLPDDQECPHLWAWVEKVLECPSVKKAMAVTSPDAILEYAKKIRKMYFGISDA